MVLTAITQENPLSRLLRRFSADGRAGLRCFGWAGLGQFIGLGIRLASNIILARFLAPDDYGLFGTAMAVLTTLEWVSDVGVLPALVRNPRGGEPRYLLTGWWMGLGRSLTLSSAAVLASVPYARFAGQPGLAWVLCALSLRPVLLALRSPAMPLLRRNLNYRGLFVEEVAQTAVGTAVSLAAAWAFRSVAAIVLGSISGALAALLVSYMLVPLLPRFVWDRVAAKEIGHLGRQVFLNSLVMALWMNADRLLGVRFVSLSEMGLYAVAWNLASVLDTLLARACDVYFSMLARRGDPAEQAAWHASACARMAYLAPPVGGLAVALSPLLIQVLYDHRYAAAGPVFAVLVARLLVRSLGQVQFQYLLVRAEVHLATRAYAVALLVQVVLFVALVPRLGPTGMALAAFGSTVAVTFVQTWLLSRRTGWGLRGFACILAGGVAGMLAIVATHR